MRGYPHSSKPNPRIRHGGGEGQVGKGPEVTRAAGTRGLGSCRTEQGVCVHAYVDMHGRSSVRHGRYMQGINSDGRQETRGLFRFPRTSFPFRSATTAGKPISEN